MPYWNSSLPTGTVSAARATPILVQSIVHTSMNSTDYIPRHDLPFPFNLEPSDTFNIFLLLGMPLVQRARPTQGRRAESREMARTNDWNVFYGLLRFHYDNEWDSTKSPFTWYKPVQRIWHRPNRPWLGRLLAMGVIPLSIQDGGVSTY